MLREFNRVLTIALLAIPTLAFAGPPPGSGYDKLVLDENFDKPIGVNGSVWNLGDWDRSFSDPRADALHQHNDKLWLNTYTENGRHRIGFVCTRGNFERKYGYIEARIKFKSRSGLNGAFWLQSIDNEVAIRREYQNQIRPFNGYGYDDLEYFGAEIDIVEALAVHKGADYKNKWVFNIHWGDTWMKIATIPWPKFIQDVLLQRSISFFAIIRTSLASGTCSVSCGHPTIIRFTLMANKIISSRRSSSGKESRGTANTSFCHSTLTSI